MAKASEIKVNMLLNSIIIVAEAPPFANKT